MQQVIIHRPVTVRRLAEALGMQTFQLLAVLIKRSVFLAPEQEVEDATACDAAAEAGVNLIIRDDEDGEDRTPPEPAPPSPFSGIPQWRANLPGSLSSGPDPDTLSPDDD